MKSILGRIILISILFILVIPNPSASSDEKVFISPATGAKFVLIPAGTFRMGGSGSDEKQHQVTISKSFYMQTTEVTQGQWKKVMGNNPSFFKDCGDDCPVESVSWNNVREFIRRLNRQEGTNKYRLPTEAEWEYAARCGEKQEEYAGTSGESALGDYAWFSANSGGKTHPVGRKKPNGLGLYDMSGNVWEWVQDWYGDYPTASVTDPAGPSSGSDRVFRGGCWYGTVHGCRSAFRYGVAPDGGGYSIGFRLVRTF